MMEKVTRDELRTMEYGETKVFDLPNALAIESGKATAYQTQNILRCRFSVQTDYVNNRLTITKLRSDDTD